MNRLLAALLALLAVAVYASPIEQVKRTPSPAVKAESASIPEATKVNGSKNKRDDSFKSVTSGLADVSAVNPKDDENKSKSDDDDKKSKSDDDDKKSKSDDDKKSKSDDDDKKSKSDDDDKKSKSDDDDKKSKSDDDDDKTTSMSIDPAMPPGTISMKKPASTESTYIKIGQKATFEWKYESLSITPSKIDIMATCSINSKQTITLTTGHPAKKTKYVWDTGKTDKDSNIQLLTAKYDLLMFDAKGNMSMTPKPGYLSPVSFPIGIYRGQKYTPMPDEASYINAGSAYADLTVTKWMVGLSAVVIASGLQVILT